MFLGESQWTALWHTAYLGFLFIITWVPLYSDHLISLSGVERKPRHSFDGIYRFSCVKLCKVMVLYYFLVGFHNIVKLWLE